MNKRAPPKESCVQLINDRRATYSVSNNDYSKIKSCISEAFGNTITDCVAGLYTCIYVWVKPMLLSFRLIPKSL